MMTLADALRLLPEASPFGDLGTVLTRVHTDTRSLQPGDLFVALRGERFDANTFLPQARASGAAAALCAYGAGLQASGLPGLEVDDTRAALGHLAQGWRAGFTLPLIAVTGSNGKTTVTQMLAAILHDWQGEAALATQGNFNNDIGVPLTLLRLRPQHRIAVLELGMNHPGEIAYLAALAQPTVALVNNAQREHLEFMATVDAVARENGSVLAALPADGVAVFPHTDTFATLWRSIAGTRRCLTFSLAEGDDATLRTADVCGTHARWTEGAWSVDAATPAGALRLRVRQPGRHNLRNALAATACAVAAGVPLAHIARGLEAFTPVQGRTRVLQLPRQGRDSLSLIDDSYNANPDSVQAALELLSSLPGPRLMVLGDMGEVGAQGERFHAEAGAQALALGIEHLYTIGTLAAAAARNHPGARHFDNLTDLLAATRQLLPGCASVLVKGSRFMRMERVVQALCEAAVPSPSQEVSHAH